MTALIDAQALLWYTAGHRRLSRRARTFIESDENELMLSTVTVWELAIKLGLKKLSIDRPLKRYVEYWMDELTLTPAWATLEHAIAVVDLPDHHSDPFDRLLIAQAAALDTAIVTGDPAIRLYAVKVIW